MARRGTTYALLIALLAATAGSGCSVEKNTASSRFFHSLTSRFNIYHNGIESYRAGIARIEAAHVDDYAGMLYLFEHSNPKSITVAAADMERAIQKASKIITQKSITARPERRSGSRHDEEFYNRREFNEWVDDAYLLMAKARFHRHEFDQARATIAFSNELSTDSDVIAEGNIWLARIHSETGNYSEALRILTESASPATLPSSLRPMYWSTLADIHIKQGEYAMAIEPLINAIEGTKNRRHKYRRTFLLAQLYGETGNSTAAISTYNEVIKMRAPYEAEFNARINMAGVYDPSAGGAADIRRQLLGMLRDEKNREYLDQVYMALGQLSEKEGNMPEAIDYYRQATAAGSQNRTARGRAYLSLATHYYSIPDYFMAGHYYDSAAMFLDDQFPGIAEIRNRSDNLGLLVRELTIMQYEDSLRMVTTMSPPQRSALIAGIIEGVREERTRAASDDTQRDTYNIGQFYESERRFRDNIEQEGSWYFYNQSALAFGRSEFGRRWGDRPLEDNWRRRNKRDIAIGEIDTGERLTEAEAGIADPSDLLNPEFYLRNLPMNDSLFALSVDRSARSKFQAGVVYLEKFNERTNAAEVWEELVTGYSDHEVIPQTLYRLHLLYRDSDTQRAEVYRNMLLSRFPESDYALILSDPDFFRRQHEEEARINTLYERAYNLYLSGEYAASAAICEDIAVRAPEHQLMPQTSLLYALTWGARGDEQAFWDNLSAVIKAHPGTDQAARASEMMDAIGREMPEIKIEADRAVVADLYSYDPTGPHFFVVLIKDPRFNINRAVFDVINYNIDAYRDRNFRADGQLVEGSFITVTVGRFTDAGDALEYYRQFDALKTIRDSSPSTTLSFVISPQNLEALRGDKDADRYMLFFREHYLRNVADDNHQNRDSR